MTGAVRIGAGAGFAGDRIDPAVELAERGNLQYLVFECLAERTVALAVQERRQDPALGYDSLLDERMRAVLPAARRNGVRIISNMGAANPAAAARRTAAIATELGLGPLRIAAVLGDDVTALVRDNPALLSELPGHLRIGNGNMISANVYLGCEPIVQALRDGADIVLTGRVADPSLFLAPLVHEFRWAPDDWRRLGQGTVIGHLLECAGQVTGGYFADPGYNDVPGLADLGFPLAEVGADAAAVITKVAGTGGRVCVAGCKQQLLYELHDPSRYLTPDVCADFSSVRLEQVGEDRVRVTGGGGSRRPAALKVSVGREEGHIGEGQITYAGSGAVQRGRLALAIVEQRLKRWTDEIHELRLELIGVDSVQPLDDHHSRREPFEVRARVAARTRTLEAARRVGREVEALYTNGPAGGGGVSSSVRPVIAIESALVAREQLACSLHWESVR